MDGLQALLVLARDVQRGCSANQWLIDVNARRAEQYFDTLALRIFVTLITRSH